MMQETQPASPPKLLFSARMTVTFMVFLGCVITYILRLNLGFAMVCMVQKTYAVEKHVTSVTNITNVSSAGNITVRIMTSTAKPKIKKDECEFAVKKHAKKEKPHEFKWEKSLQGAILGAFFYGYIVTNVIAGWLCEKIGGKKVLVIGLGVASCLALAIPEMARVSPYALLAVRTVQGLFGAVSFPCFHHLIGNWAPPDERGTLYAIAYSGIYVGTLVTFPLCGVLCDSGLAGGWPSVFYVTGSIGIAWVIAVLFLVYENADKHPRISPEERLYLDLTLQPADEKVLVPWGKIAKSLPVWAINIAHLCANWGLYTLALTLPSYMNEVHKFPIKENGFLSSLPYICSLVVNLICGKLTDILLHRKVASLTLLRKIFNTVGMVCPAICFFVLTLLDCTNRYWAVGIVVLLQASSTIAFAGGFFYNHADIAPQLAGVLMGISNTFGTVSGIASPILTGVLTPHGTLKEWSIVFYIGLGAYVVGALFYLVYGTAKRQPWAAEHPPSTTELQTQYARKKSVPF